MARLGPHDAEWLWGFYNSIPADERRFFRPHGDSMSLAVAQGIVRASLRGRRRDVVAHASTIVGWAFLVANDRCEKNELSLGIAVLPASRRRGVADRLMSELLDPSHLQGIASVRLTVVQDNAAALALYKKHGFEQIDSFFAEDEFRFAMRKQL